MKILSVAWTFYCKEIPELSNLRSGIDSVVANICEYIGKKEESYVMVGMCKTPGIQTGHIKIVNTDYDLEQEPPEPSECSMRIRILLKKFESALEEIKPDIVDFHGIGEFMSYCIQICIAKKVPYVYTEHLYISQGKREFEGYDDTADLEKKLYANTNMNIIAVSTGMKKNILRDFPNIGSERIQVITNGTDFIKDNETDNMSTNYGKGEKLLLCVGTILERKNQRQIVRAYKLLPDGLKQKIKIVFLGNDRLHGKLQEDILDNHLEDNVCYAGGVGREKMKAYYEQASGLVVASYSEGLSIAALEAIAYGLPLIMFSDSECADDLADDKVVCFATKRTDECLAAAIEKWYESKWDSSYIRKYSQNFSMERVAKDYIDCYKKILSI